MGKKFNPLRSDLCLLLFVLFHDLEELSHLSRKTGEFFFDGLIVRVCRTVSGERHGLSGCSPGPRGRNSSGDMDWPSIRLLHGK